MKIDDRAVKGLAQRGIDLWLNLELSRFKPDGEYDRVVEFLKQRFKSEEVSPLLLVLGLLEMALIEDALRNRTYLTDEEREAIIKEVVEALAEKFPQIVKEMLNILNTLDSKIEEFKIMATKFGSGGE